MGFGFGSQPTERHDCSAPRRQPAMARRPGQPRAPATRRRANTDTVKLLMLGYRQELAREFTLFNCFGCSFTALSSLTAVGGTYYIGLTYGGPVVMMWGWLVVMLFTTSVGLSMAELASAYPTSGALYYWSYTLAPPRLRNLACWLTAWILTLGQAALSASAFYTFVEMSAAAVRVQFGFTLSKVQEFGVLMAIFAVTGCLNCGSARLTAFMTTLGTMWHIVALAAFCVVVPLLAPSRNSVEYVFTSWQPNHEATGISSPVYITLVGLLMAQWSLTGYDGSAHLAEETLNAEYNVPRAILVTIIAGGACGFAMILALTFVRLDPVQLTDPNNETGGINVVLQILIEITKAVYGSVGGGVALFTIPIVGTFFCSYQCIANNSRMLYAFARDNGVPLASLAKRVHPTTRAPVYGVLYMLLLTSLLATPMCFNAYVFPAVTSFAVVGCYLAYALPVLCKLSTGRRFFLPGPFFLGPRLSYANNLVSLAWVLTVTVLFTLPQFYPISLLNMNWSAPILGVVLAFSLGWYYFPGYGARRWFIGPRANLGQFQDVLPSDLARIASQQKAAKLRNVPPGTVVPDVPILATGTADVQLVGRIPSVQASPGRRGGGGGSGDGATGTAGMRGAPRTPGLSRLSRRSMPYEQIGGDDADNDDGDAGDSVAAVLGPLETSASAAPPSAVATTSVAATAAAAVMSAIHAVAAAASRRSLLMTPESNVVDGAAVNSLDRSVRGGTGVNGDRSVRGGAGVNGDRSVRGGDGPSGDRSVRGGAGASGGHDTGTSVVGRALSLTQLLRRSQSRNTSSSARGRTGLSGSTASRRGAATELGAKTRQRASALGLLDGRVSCASHIALLLQGDDGLLDDDGDSDGDVLRGVAAGVGRASERPSAPRLWPTGEAYTMQRNGSFSSVMPLGRIEPWFNGFRGSGGGGGSDAQKRTSASSIPERSSLASRAALVTDTASTSPAAVAGAGVGPATTQGFLRHTAHPASPGATAPVNVSDGGVDRASRARLRRASVSVIALRTSSNGCGVNAPVGRPAVTPATAVAPAAVDSVGSGTDAGANATTQVVFMRSSADQYRRGGGSGSGNSGHSRVRLVQPATQRTRWVSASGGGAEASVPLALQHCVRHATSVYGVVHRTATAAAPGDECDSDDGAVGGATSRFTFDGAERHSHTGRVSVSVCIRVPQEVDPSVPSPSAACHVRTLSQALDSPNASEGLEPRVTAAAAATERSQPDSDCVSQKSRGADGSSYLKQHPEGVQALAASSLGG